MAAPSITLSAPAKLNLTLDVLEPRPDGFHEIRSLVTGVDLADRVTCRLTSCPGIDISCSDALLASPENLCVRAIKAFGEHVGIDPALAVDIRKRIPVAAGLGGGSSDAASSLRICNELWNTRLSTQELGSIGSEIGSDVPLFFSLPHAVITGRGEIVERVGMRWSGWALLVFGDVPVLTAEVFRSWRASDAIHTGADRIERILAARSATEITPHLSNDLTEAVFRVCPRIRELRDDLAQCAVGSFHLSGAGSTFYQLFDEEDMAAGVGSTITDQVTGIRVMVVAVFHETDHPSK